MTSLDVVEDQQSASAQAMTALQRFTVKPFHGSTRVHEPDLLEQHQGCGELFGYEEGFISHLCGGGMIIPAFPPGLRLSADEF